MDFVNDDDAVAASRRPKWHCFLKPSHIIDAVMGGAVHFEYIDIAALCDISTAVATVARRWAGAPFAIERFGQNACTCGFANAARACEQKSVRHAVFADGVLKRAADGFLPYEVFKSLRAILSGKYSVGHGEENLARVY
jgi:hypothetical protein